MTPLSSSHLFKTLSSFTYHLFVDFAYAHFWSSNVFCYFCSATWRAFLPSTSDSLSFSLRIGITFVTTPVPRVKEPSRRVNLWPCSKTMGLISFKTNLKLKRNYSKTSSKPRKKSRSIYISFNQYVINAL